MPMYTDCKRCGSKIDKPNNKRAICRSCEADNDLRRRYGITMEERNQMLKDQGGCCKICSSPVYDYHDERSGKNRLGIHYACVDHCHTTGKVRGILCGRCNATLGKCNDDIKILASMINYLKEDD